MRTSGFGDDGVQGAPLTVEQRRPRAFRVAGELDLSNAAQLERLLDGATREGGDLTLEVSGLTYLDSAGLHLLIRAASALSGRGRLRVVGPGRSVARVIETTGVELIDNLEVVGAEDGRRDDSRHHRTLVPHPSRGAAEDPLVSPPAGR